jgi:hypothetical protein
VELLVVQISYEILFGPAFLFVLNIAPYLPQEIAGMCTSTSFSAKKLGVFMLDLVTNAELVAQNKLRDYS